MSVKSLIAKFEKEKEDLQNKITACQERIGVLDVLLKELKGAARGTVRRKKAAAKPKGRKKRARKKGGLTVREAIVKTVATAGAPMTAGDIIKGAAALSGGAAASIRTQINSLAKGGELQQVPYEGRGFKYQIPKAKPKAKPKVKAKAAKPAKK